eukprot:scaffold1172_cov247-Pinguiococcus_pyrenoidosus.AAC.12
MAAASYERGDLCLVRIGRGGISSSTPLDRSDYTARITYLPLAIQRTSRERELYSSISILGAVAKRAKAIIEKRRFCGEFAT